MAPRILYLVTFSLLAYWVLFHDHRATQARSYSPIRSTTQQQTPAPQTVDVVSLQLGKPVERELSGGQKHEYQITLAEGQYAFVVVEQRGIDVFVQLFGTDAKLIAGFDFGSEGRETVGTVAETAGSYRLLVGGKLPRLSAGRYEIRLLEVRAATEKDRLHHESARLRTEAARLVDAGKYAEALPLAEKTLELRERLFGAESSWLVHNIRYLAFINYRLGNYAKAEALQRRGLVIVEKSFGAEHPQVAYFLTSLADTHGAKGEDARAVPVYQRALAILEKKFGPEHPALVHPLHQLGVTYRRLGDFVLAEPALERSLAVAEKAFGADDVEVASSLGSLAKLYAAKGDYAKAEPLYRRAVAITEKAQGTKHPALAIWLNNLATVYHEMGDYDQAEPLYRRALAIQEEAMGPDHPEAACTRGNLADIPYARGDYAKAEPLYLSTLAVREKALGPKHPMVGLNLYRLAALHFARDNYAKAEPLYQRALSIYEAAYGTNYYHLAGILADLAKMSAAEGRVTEAIVFQARANAIVEHNLALNLTTGSERQKLAYLRTLSEQLDHAVSLHTRFAADDRAARELAAATVLQRKGRVKDALSNSLASLHRRFSAEDRDLLERLNGVASQLGRLVLNEPECKSLAEYQEQVRRLEEERENLENQISRRSAEFYAQAQSVTLAAIRSAIPDDAALVELAVYRPFDSLRGGAKAYGHPRYVAYVVRRRGEVRFAELGEAKKIEQAIATLRQALRDPTRRDVRKLARAVDEKVMQPVRALVGDATQLLISPDGELNLVPFSALIDERGRYLVQRYSIAYLTSGRDLLRLQGRRDSKSAPVVVADPAFGEPQVVAATGGMGHSQQAPARLDYSRVFFGPLPGVGDEVRALRELLPQATFLTKDRATEAALKQVSAPRILHVATHGFFLRSDKSDSEPAQGDAKSGTRLGKWAARVENPLLRSGLALAGANQGRSGEDDGILTALEATALDLWGTKLVVLSACDTGVGEIKNGEGVYGLRRALMLAGAESQMMSLWPVSDRSTRDLMIQYYEALVQDVGRGEALRRVQLQMLRSKVHSHPYYWASFILTGEWANLQGKR